MDSSVVQLISSLFDVAKYTYQLIDNIKNGHIVKRGGIKLEPMNYVAFFTQDGMPVRKWYVTYPGGCTWHGYLSKNWRPHGYGEFRNPEGDLIPDGRAGFWDDGKFLGRHPTLEWIAFEKGFLCYLTAYDSPWNYPRR